MLKLGGALLLVLSGFLAGQLLQNSYVVRTKQLNQVKMAIVALSSEISCTRASLPVAMRRVSDLTEEPVASLLRECAHQMDGLAATAGEAWLTACRANFGLLCLGESERQVLLEVGSALGLARLDEQLKRLEYARQRISFLEEAALRERERARLWSYGGFAVGAVACLLLI